MNIKRLVKYGYLKTGALLYNSRESRVIYYHDIHDENAFTSMSTPMERFKEHIYLIQENGYSVVSEISKKSNELEIIFDDGFRGLFENFDYFIDKKLPVTIFIVTDFIGERNFLTQNELKDMLSTGLLRIGSHTKTHSDLDKLSNNEITNELKSSKDALEDIFGIEINSLCYPRGRFTDTVVKTAKSIGYKKQYSCLPGGYFEPFKEGLINRSLVQDATPQEFTLILKGADRIFHKRYLQQHYHKTGDKSN